MILYLSDSKEEIHKESRWIFIFRQLRVWGSIWDGLVLLGRFFRGSKLRLPRKISVNPFRNPRNPCCPWKSTVIHFLYLQTFPYIIIIISWNLRKTLKFFRHKIIKSRFIAKKIHCKISHNQLFYAISFREIFGCRAKDLKGKFLPFCGWLGVGITRLFVRCCTFV